MTSPTLMGALATAGVLGVTHAIEPDHVAGISSLAGETGNSYFSALVGACFSLGHVALVVAWLAVVAVLDGRGALPEGLDAVGTVGVAVLLGILGTAMAVGGLRTVVRTDEHTHGDRTHAHPHVHLPMPGFEPEHEHDHGVAGLLKTGVVGAMFTLSPPLSMLAFAGTLFPNYGLEAVALAVVVYAVAITVTMSAIGAGVGAAFGATQRLDARAHGALRTFAGVAVAGLAAVMLFSTGFVG